MGPDFHFDETSACLEGSSNISLSAALVMLTIFSVLILTYFLFYSRNASCDLRVQLPGVALEHAKVSRSENREVSCL